MMRIALAVPLLLLAVAGCGSTRRIAVPGPTVTRHGPTVTAAGPTVTVPAPTATTTVTATAAGGQAAPEACGKLLYGADGNLGNAVCPDGRPSVAAVDFFRDAHYVTIDLDPSTTPQQVAAALCADNRSLTNPLRLTLYDTANALNRWNFPAPPVNQIGELAASCPS